MHFPIDFNFFGHQLPAHGVMEVLAYSGGFQIYLLLRRQLVRGPLGPRVTPLVPVEQNLWVIVGAIFGALVGSKLLAWLESWPDYLQYWQRTHNLALLLGGKTIVGGLLGGWIGVEVAKKILGIRFSTGDLYVYPLIFGMSVGRVGCFLTGLADHTCGSHTTVPWAVDFGDGPRHPVQLYDILFLWTLGIGLFIRSRLPYENGRLFRLFVLGYCLYRFSVEFLKDIYHPYLGLSAIQIACLIAAAVCIWIVYLRPQKAEF